MRVGANARQFARIKKMHAAGTPANVIAGTFRMTAQSLEKILAHLDGREVRTIAVEDSPEMQVLRQRNADLSNRLARYEEVQDGEVTETVDAEKEDAEAEEDPDAEAA